MDRSFEETHLIDDFSSSQKASSGQVWQYVSDNVMGGVSHGFVQYKKEQDKPSLVLSGTVSLKNNGGFIQANIDLGASGSLFDARGATGVAITLCGDGQCYAINLRTADTRRPWQSYRSPIQSTPHWQTHYLSFSSFKAHRIEQPLNISQLRRIGLIAIGSPGPVEVAMSRVALYRHRAST